ELWVSDLVFTSEELKKGKNIKYCVVSGSSENAELIQLKVDSISNGGKTVSFKLRHVDVDSAFEEITKIFGKEGFSMLDVFGSQKVVDLFLMYPVEFVEIAKASVELNDYVFNSFINDAVALLFAKNPNAFVEIARAAGINSNTAFDALISDKRISDLLVSDSDVVVDAFVEIAKYNRHQYSVFNTFQDEKVVEKFLDYCNGKISFDKFIIVALASDSFAIDIGRPLDSFHAMNNIREQYLSSLSDLQVFALLNSNPEFFYMSSNNMLFDRLKKDLGDKSITHLFEEYDLIGTDECRNFLFRAINYDRFYGKSNSLLNESDVKALLPTLLEPLNSDEFDDEYFFLLANALNKIKGIPEVASQVKLISEKRLQEGIEDKKLKAAFEITDFFIDNQTNLVSEDKKNFIRELENEKSVYDPDFYRNNGKITVLQVFDKEDTGKDHWFFTQDWFTAYFGSKPVVVSKNELVYENDNARMILFMGDTDEENQEFITSHFNETPNLILTFRGHSYSLLNIFPYGIFENINSYKLFIPGSCGSAGSTPEYISSNPDTDLRFISNTSTGIGQVTNAIVQTLLDSDRKSFDELIADSASAIKRNGGDPSTIKVFSTGELLLAYVLEET
ncbi:hypothetical protein KKG83_08315, partial [Candidatus Micrarchaeota archaeon]|nr:hypothetical protein [Candidatus Micrarchaeota archaeon]